MKFDKAFFDGGINRRGTQCAKWDSDPIVKHNSLPMQVADMDFPCAPVIQEAIIERAKHDCYGYTNYGPEDNQALIDFWKRRHGLAIAQEQLMRIPCVIEGMRLCIRTFTNPGDKIIIFTPVYPPFHSSVSDNDRELVCVPLLRNAETGRFDMNYEGLEEALKQGAKMALLCNPQNPLSRLWQKDELEKVCALIKKYNAVLVSDEIHADFVYAPAKLTPMLSIKESWDCTVMLCSASKTFNIAGLQQANLVCFNPDMLKALQKEAGNIGMTSGNIFALYATRAAYNEGDEWLEGLLAYLDEGRKVLEESVKEYLPKAVIPPIEATYLTWLDLTAYGKTCGELTELFRAHGVELTPGTAFDKTAEGCMRICFGCPHNMIREGVKRLGEALKEE